MPRSALIVDDSRTALAALSRQLTKLGIDSDTVESGPEALAFLNSNSPGVIFLDHMMPGMDGFETLAAIKANPRTAAIPVVMYTSREGEAYMGQALVQGAFGVLQKPVDTAELEQILRRVDQLRAPPGVDSGGRAARPRAAVTGVIHVPPEFRSRPATPSAPATADTDSSSQRVAAGHKPAVGYPWGRILPRIMLALVLLMPGAWYFERYQQAEQLRAQAQSEILALRAEQRSVRELALARESSQQRAEFASPPRRGVAESRGLLDTVAWALNQHGQYGLNDVPLGDTRLAQLRELVARLAAAGFQGSVRIETHVGEFCLVRDELGILRLPGEGSSIQTCEVVTYPPAQAVQLGQRQSPAFARYLAERRPGNPIQITVLSHGAHHPLVAYPDPASVQTAGDWNRTARLNQRVEITLLPAP